MIQKEKQTYRSTQERRELNDILNREKLILDCGRHVTFNQVTGKSGTIQNNTELLIFCSECNVLSWYHKRK